MLASMWCALAFVTGAVLPEPQVTFPDDFLGDWRGTMEWRTPGKPEPQRVAMRIRIAGPQDDGSYTYRLTYGDKETDDRPYVLKPVDKEKGHWQIDERNGIVLDQYWTGERFVGVFTVSGNTITASLRRDGPKLVSEMTTFEAAATSTTGDGKVTTNRVKSVQRADLTKSKG